ncbi:MAG: cob(I)yrinic acid a,c-diamide adenosyltransferase [Dysgonamonadaceae bacterium]|jgi:cob(I)alamin adenosyltransferase|nr:cob(I)yrinic acid a,c-diamide adenosyltransferase [Dysgonamonadaceae bacterium]
MARSKIYTRKGDDGFTSLVGGKRVSKASSRIEAYGTIDELNAFIACLSEETGNEHDRRFLRQIQYNLFTLGSYLASEAGTMACPVSEENVKEIELEMDEIDALLPSLKHFILPGGCKSNALAHVCRTICRRAERNIFKIPEVDEIDINILQYVNRLSDYFFLLSRKQSFLQNIEEIIWENPCK